MANTRQDRDAGLNPALKRSVNTTLHDTSTSSPAPVETTSVQREEGRGWPVTWLVIAVLGILLAIYLLIG